MRNVLADSKSEPVESCWMKTLVNFEASCHEHLSIEIISENEINLKCLLRFKKIYDKLLMSQCIAHVDENLWNVKYFSI